MDEIEKGKIGLACFFLFIIALAVGGFFLMKHVRQTKEEPKQKEEVVENKKLESEKDYIYFTDEKAVSVDLQIIYKKVVINLDSADATNVTKEINADFNEFDKSIKYISDVTLEENQTLLYETDNIFSAKVRDFDVYETAKYVSLTVFDYDYSALGSPSVKIPRSYVFELKSGKLINATEALALYNLTLDDVIAKIKKELEQKQTTITKEDGTTINLINIDETVENFKFNENLSIYINEKKELCANYIVKTNEINYNETIILS